MNSLSGIDSILLFQNSQGKEGRGTLIHITRTTVVFEVYNPYSIIQISEVLQKVRVVRGERVIYDGKAVVSNIVMTGLMLIVSATLVDAWSDLSEIGPGRGLNTEAKRFVDDWENSNRLYPGYQVVVNSISSFLSEISRWLEEAEVGSELSANTNGRFDEKLFEEFYEEVKEPLSPKVTELFGSFEEVASKISPEELNAHKAFARRELHPVTMCSPFVHRTYVKPLGYAGDYEMVNMMLYESDAKCRSIYAKLVDDFHVGTSAPEAHRNRIDLLVERLENETVRAIQQERPLVALNVGCGPASEVQRFLKKSELSDHLMLTLMDFNDETIAYSKQRTSAAREDAGREATLNYVQKSVDDLLRESQVDELVEDPKYDFVYCAGLFDYFSDRVCKKLVALFYSWVKPGGLVSVTNVHKSNPNRNQMEHLLEWHLIYRDDKDMLALAPEDTQTQLIQDDTGVNVFLDIRK